MIKVGLLVLHLHHVICAPRDRVYCLPKPFVVTYYYTNQKRTSINKIVDELMSSTKVKIVSQKKVLRLKL